MKLSREYQLWKKTWRKKIQKVKKKRVKGKEVRCRPLLLHRVQSRTVIENGSVLVVIGIKNVNEREVGKDVIDIETEVEVVTKGIAAVSVTETAVVKEKGIEVAASEAAQSNVRVTTEETKTGIVETARTAGKIVNRNEIEAKEAKIVTNTTTKRKIAKRVAVPVLPSILKLQKRMPCELSWGWLLCDRNLLSFF